jgi:hypothetical protein
MKRSLPLLTAAVSLAILLAAGSLAHAQAEKVKQKAKDLKKQVEGTPAQTNQPPRKASALPKA